MCESLLKRDTKEIILVEKRREVAVQGYQGKIVQLPSEVPWRQDTPRPAADSKQREMLVLGRRWFQCRRIFTQAALQAHK